MEEFKKFIINKLKNDIKKLNKKEAKEALKRAKEDPTYLDWLIYYEDLKPIFCNYYEDLIYILGELYGDTIPTEVLEDYPSIVWNSVSYMLSDEEVIKQILN